MSIKKEVKMTWGEAPPSAECGCLNARQATYDGPKARSVYQIMTEHPCAVWDFTQCAPVADEDALRVFQAALGQLFKKWCFQHERADTGYLHFQGRGSLFKKRRKHELQALLAPVGLPTMHISVTSKNVADSRDLFYVMKADTRVAGPWRNDTTVSYVPRQYRGLLDRLYPFQQQIWDSFDTFDSRMVNLVYCPEGFRGKTTIAALCALHRGCLRIPSVNDAEKLLATVCDILHARECRVPGIVLVDLPRAMDKSKLYGLYSAIEEIKAGYVYDMRYAFKDWWFDSPAVWVFSNSYPDIGLLSPDRWAIWSISEHRRFVPLVPHS